MAVFERDRNGRPAWPPIANAIKLVGAAVIVNEEFFRHAANNLLIGAAIVCVAGVQVVENIVANLLEKLWAKPEPVEREHAKDEQR
jgi:hypothetical protein